MDISASDRLAARAVDMTLRQLMPNSSGAMSYSAVARHCGCASRTPRSWLLWDDEISVPDQPSRGLLAELVEREHGADARQLLEDGWEVLLRDDEITLDLTEGSGSESLAGIGTGGVELTLADRRLVVDQARVLLEEAYAHLPFKRSLHAVDPVQRLRLLDYRLSQQQPGEQPEAAFHREMIDIFTSLRDLHTTYVVPHRFREAVVLLPFRVEEYFEPSGGRGGTASPQAVYVASKVAAPEAIEAGFVDGVRITHWNGVPMQRAIELLAEKQAAGNDPAAFGRALDALTLRPLLSSMVPDEEWVEVRYVDDAGATGDVRFTWEPRDAPADVLPDHVNTALGIDAQTYAVSAVRKEIYARNDQQWTQAAENRGALRSPVALQDFHLETTMPWIFRAHRTRDQRYGYIRIFSFTTRKPDVLVTEFARLAGELPDTGLIIDVRGNAGGSIVAAEGVLQVLSAADIRPSRAQFTTSPLLLSICERHRKPSNSVPLALAPWVDSLRNAVITGSPYSRGFPITSPEFLASVTERYAGPVVLIVDALCYSATDMFAAGFIDHRVGRIVGTADNTGAGGGNVWLHSDLLKLAGPDSDLEPLPGGIDMRVAVRRTTRVHDHEGEILEDLGVQIDHRHHMTRADVLEGNRDLIAAAAAQLKKQNVGVGR